MDDDVQAIELRRLGELQKQAALTGPHTPPHVLIEIQDITNRYPHVKARQSDANREYFNYNLLMNSVGAALQRLTQHEIDHKDDTNDRRNRQLLMNVWMVLITVIALVNLILLLTR